MVKLDDCRHFNGIQHGECRAGVAYDGLARPLPCLTNFRGEGSPRERCAKFEPFTQAEVDAIEAELEAHDDRLSRGISSCCEASIVDQRGRTLEAVAATKPTGCVWFYCSNCKRQVMRLNYGRGRR